jgi:protein TonB
MRAGIEGSVEVELMIGDDGTVSHARVVRSANPIFDQAAINAAEQWLFAKPTAGPVVRTVELTFTLSKSATATPRARVSADSDALRVGGNIRTPSKIKHVSPAYPPLAKSARVAGLVILEVLIDREGRVTDAQVLRSIPLLDQAAIDAVMQWAFTPTLLNGNPMPVIMTVTVNFTPE